MKKFFVIAALLISAVSFAQETNRDANGNKQFGPYETNKFFDNWFIQVAGGVNHDQDYLTNLFKGEDGFKQGLGLNVKANLGKWFDPCYGARIGWTGLVNGKLVEGTGAEFATSKDNGAQYNYIHADGLVNLSNLFGGYKETRCISFVGYLTAGYAFQNKMFGVDERSFAAGLGLEMPIRLGGVVSIVPAFEWVGMRAQVFNGDDFGGVASATLGLNFNLGKNNWTRKATTLAAAGAALAAAEAAANALRAQNEKLAADAAAANAAKNALANENEALRKELEALRNAPKCAGVDLAENPIIAYFEIGKATLSEKELAHFDYQVKTALAQNAGQKLLITGKADGKTGSKSLNEKLSKKRAEYLFDLLTNKYGLDADNFSIANEVVAGSRSALDRAGVISK